MMEIQNLEIKLEQIRRLSKRLQKGGFAWQHDDFFVLQELLPGLLESKKDEHIVKLVKQGAKLLEALAEYQKFNAISNDLDAYLFHYGEWALGEEKDRPRPEDYGIGQP